MKSKNNFKNNSKDQQDKNTCKEKELANKKSIMNKLISQNDNKGNN